MSVSRTKNPRVVTTRTLTTMKRMGGKDRHADGVRLPRGEISISTRWELTSFSSAILSAMSSRDTETTLPVTVDDMIYHAKAVKRAVKNALIVVDMPFMSYQTSIDDAVRNCGPGHEGRWGGSGETGRGGVQLPISSGTS